MLSGKRTPAGLHWITLPLTAVVALALVSVFTAGRWSTRCGQDSKASYALGSAVYRKLTETRKPEKTLVTYIFSNTNAEYINNLRFFARWGIREDDGAEYVVIVQQAYPGEPGSDIVDLPTLPSNARYVHHQNECYDWGTFGWLLRSNTVKVVEYSYFVILNSSVRGPFIPPYVPADFSWHSLLTQKLRGDVKMVGPTISCGGTAFKGNVSLGVRQNPHVQSFVLAMDQEAVQLLLKDREVLACWSDRSDAIWYAELGASKAVLDAGFNLDCLLRRYQGIDWRKRDYWGCNGGMNPSEGFNFDGFDLLPYDTLFVKFKDGMHDSILRTPQVTLKYEAWMDNEEHDPPKIAANDLLSNRLKYTQPYIRTMAERGQSCFDFDYYRTENPDVADKSDSQLWQGFLDIGQFEGELYRFLCDGHLSPNLEGSEVE